MLELLSPEEIETLLEEGFVGRIGCHAEGRTYVVPIAYAYQDGCVYAHTTNGLKVRMMRKNPVVCFEVDVVENVYNWRSVVAQGTFEELHGDAAERAMRTVLLRFLPAKTHATARAMPSTRPGVTDERAIVYRIRLVEKTGRFERS